MKSGSYLKGLLASLATVAVLFMGNAPRAEALVTSNTPLYLQHAKDFGLHVAKAGHDGSFGVTAHESHASHSSHSSHSSHASHASHYSSR